MKFETKRSGSIRSGDAYQLSPILGGLIRWISQYVLWLRSSKRNTIPTDLPMTSFAVRGRWNSQLLVRNSELSVALCMSLGWVIVAADVSISRAVMNSSLLIVRLWLHYAYMVSRYILLTIYKCKIYNIWGEIIYESGISTSASIGMLQLTNCSPILRHKCWYFHYSHTLPISKIIILELHVYIWLNA